MDANTIIEKSFSIEMDLMDENEPDEPALTMWMKITA